MKNFEIPIIKQEKPEDKEGKYEALHKNPQDEILRGFSESEREEINKKRNILSSLAYFIGKDFEIPVELNKPGEGWHWNFKENKIRIDPKSLLESPMEELRYLICHEGGHRRVSRTEFIPLEEWNEPGFAPMMNFIEDPRNDNFVAENYPKYVENIDFAWGAFFEKRRTIKEKAREKLGYEPRFMKAGFEYIKQWFRERKGEDFEVSEDLPEEVKEVVKKTLASAQDSWWRYPSRQEADDKESGEENIKAYAKVSYEINRDEIWPEFKKLVEEDMKDQKMQEFMKDMGKGKAEGEGGQEIPQDIKDKLTPEEQKELEDAIVKAIGKAKQENEEKTDASEEKPEERAQGDREKGKLNVDAKGKGAPIDMDSLSDELKQKIKEYIDLLPEEKRKDLEEKARKTLGEFGQEIADDVGGKFSDNPQKRKDRGESEQDAPSALESEPEKIKLGWKESEVLAEKDQRELRKKMEETFESKNESQYRDALEEVSPLIDELTGDLRDIFVKRKLEKKEAGYRYGRRWNIKKRIMEKIAGIPLIKTESREQPESPSEEKDYAVTLMIDLSGSMMGRKIQETFKSVVVLAETLNNLDIKFEVAGFQDILLEFKSFEEEFTDEMRKKLNGLVLEVSDSNPGGHNNMRDNNDGECLLEASKSLSEQSAGNKFLIVLSDGAPAMDSGKKSSGLLDIELREAVNEVTENTDQKLIGIGLLSNAVSKYYENNLPNVSTEEMTETLGELLREMIENS